MFHSFLLYKISRIKESKTSCFISWLPLPPPHFLQILHSPQVKVIIFWIYGCGHCWLWNIKTSHRLPDQDCRTSFRCVFLMLCTENRNMCLYLSQHVWTWKWVKKMCSALFTKLSWYCFIIMQWNIWLIKLIGYNIFMVTTCIGNLSNNCIIPKECIVYIYGASVKL